MSSNVDIEMNLASDDVFEVKSLLSNYWKPFVVTAWVHFIVFQVALECNRRLSAEPICPYSDIDSDAWYWRVHNGILDAFISLWVLLAFKLLRADKSPMTKKVILLKITTIMKLRNFKHQLKLSLIHILVAGSIYDVISYCKHGNDFYNNSPIQLGRSMHW